MSTLEERVQYDLKNSEEELREMRHRSEFLVEHIKRLRAVLGEALSPPNPKQGVLIVDAPLRGLKATEATSRVLKENGGRMSLGGIVEKLIAGGFREINTPDDKKKFRNSLASVLYNAAKEPQKTKIGRDHTSPGYFLAVNGSH